MSRSWLFSFEDGDVIQDNGLKADDLVNAQNDVAEFKESEVELEKDIVTVENNIVAFNRLVEQKEKNDELLQENDETGIVDEDVLISQETFLITLATLGVTKKDIHALRISRESSLDNYTKLAISQEGIIDSIKQILKGIIDLFISIGKKIKEYVKRFVNWLFNKKGSIQKMIAFCQKYPDNDMATLESKGQAKLSELHSTYLLASNGILDPHQIMEFYSDIRHDPFINKVDEFIKVLQEPSDKIEEASNQLVASITKDADSNSLHKTILDITEKNSKEKPIYIIGVNGNKITMYGYQEGKKDTHKLGFSLITTKLTQSGTFKEIKGCKKLGDLVKPMNELLKNIDNANSFSQQITRANETAVKSIQQVQKRLDNNTLTDKVQGEIIKSGLQIVKDIGSKSLVAMVANYATNNSNLSKTFEYFVQPLMKANKKAEKEANKK